MIFGFFDSAEATEPKYDPGLEIDCPICHSKLARPMRTVSFMGVNGDTSYFYRTHRGCGDEEAERRIESSVIDAMQNFSKMPTNLC